VTDASSIVAIDAARLDEAVAVLESAFTDYPVFTFVLPPRTEDRDAKLTAVMRYYAMRRLSRGWPAFALQVSGAFRAIILANPPRHAPVPAEVLAMEEALIETLGADAEARRRRYETQSDLGEPGVPHFFVGMLAVHPDSRGRGYAKRLLEHVHTLSLADPDSGGVALATESADNLPLYRHLGYRVRAEADVGPLHTWALWRPQVHAD